MPKIARTKSKVPHLIVKARAGTGKTTTLIGGLQVLKGMTPCDAKGRPITPSPQQRLVWDSIALSKNARSVCFVAFNKSIANELQSRVPAGCQAMTMHSLGYKAVRSAFGNVRVDEYRTSDIICSLMGYEPQDVRRNQKLATILKGTRELVDLVKMNLSDTDPASLSALVSHYDLELNGETTEVFELVPAVIERAKDVQRTMSIDFADMIWIPVILGLPIPQYDLLLVDEAQDLNRCQQALALSSGKRLVLCGDPKQAIYGFAGADSESMSRMFDILSTTNSGCDELPLTVTRRCGKAIVKEANKIVEDFDAFETNPEGIISRAVMGRSTSVPVGSKHYRDLVQDGDMVLCRVNAPLVTECFAFIKAGIKANIQGRDVGQGLISLIKKSKTSLVEDLIRWLDSWLDKERKKELAKRNPSDSRMIALEDKYDCIICLTEGRANTDQVIRAIEELFTDDRSGRGIRFSSVHKAKGLESHRVFLLEPEKATIPHPMARTPWQIDQEWNLRYVAITRAIEELVYVSGK